MGLSNASKSGVAIFAGAVQFGIGLILAEVYYPNYNVSTNAISDLGATCPSGGGPCVINQPASTIFNTSVVILGLLILVSGYFFQRSFRYKSSTAVILLSGVGAIGVGLFPETTGIWHGLFSLITFLFAGLSALVNARFQRKPLSYFSIALGLFTLVATVLYVGTEYLGLGQGGMERMIVYPVLLWVLGFGGHLMATNDPVPA
jgi:hypothetical membrane protein